MNMQIWTAFVAMMGSHAFKTDNNNYAKCGHYIGAWCEIQLRVVGKKYPRLEVWCAVSTDPTRPPHTMTFTATNKAHDIRFKVREAFELLAREVQ